MSNYDFHLKRLVGQQSSDLLTILEGHYQIPIKIQQTAFESQVEVDQNLNEDLATASADLPGSANFCDVTEHQNQNCCPFDLRELKLIELL